MENFEYIERNSGQCKADIIMSEIKQGTNSKGVELENERKNFLDKKLNPLETIKFEEDKSKQNPIKNEETHLKLNFKQLHDETNKPTNTLAFQESIKHILLTPLVKAIVKIVLTQYVILKVFLALFVLGSTGLASYLVIEIIMDYLSFEVITSTRTIFENPTLFPKITFCNSNKYATQYAFNLTQNGIQSDNSLSSEEKKKLGHELDDILIECWFNAKPCYSTDFIWSFDSKYGNCFTFNSGIDSNKNQVSLKSSFIAGYEFGLQLALYVNIYEKLLDLTSVQMGAIFRIENSSYLSFNGANDILVSPGFQTNIALNREFNFMLPRPFSECEIDLNSPKFRSNSDLYNFIVNSNYQYSQSLCFMQCLQEIVIKKYNCSIGFWLSLFNEQTCPLETVSFILLSDSTLSSDFFAKNCVPSCPTECNQTLYKSSITFNQLNGHPYIFSIQKNSNLSSDFINRSIDTVSVKESIAYVNVFYETLSYKLTVESPKIDLVSLFASIGGHLGLFLGVSVFSLCEIVEAIIETLYLPKSARIIQN